MVTLETLRAQRREEILRLAERRGAHNVRVFGSVARGEASEGSDLDLLVAWEPGRSLLDHAGLVQDLQELLVVARNGAACQRPAPRYASEVLKTGTDLQAAKRAEHSWPPMNADQRR